MKLYISKSDFKHARDCATKLYYKKQGYPSVQDDNDYLQLLAEGGFLVGEMAKTLYPEGVEIRTKNTTQALWESEELLKKDRVVLFEAALQAGAFLLRADILIKEGDRVDLIEVKSKSLEEQEDTDEGMEFLTKRGEVKSRWRPYIEDIASSSGWCNKPDRTGRSGPSCFFLIK